jgi:hypothetical protein
MKHKKKKLLIKSARKVIRKELNEQLIVDLQHTLEKFGQDSKNIKKEIKRSAGKLAKKLAQKLNIELSEVTKEDENIIVKSKSGGHEVKAVSPVAVVAPDAAKPI